MVFLHFFSFFILFLYHLHIFFLLLPNLISQFSTGHFETESGKKSLPLTKPFVTHMYSNNPKEDLTGEKQIMFLKPVNIIHSFVLDKKN